MKAEYTQGNIAQKLLMTAVAMLASTLAMSGYNMADTFFVGQIGGEEPLAAMGYTFPVVMLICCIFHGFGGGCMTTMAQALGRGDMDAASRIVTTGMQILLMISLALAIIGILSADLIFGLMGAKGNTLVLVKSYMNVWFMGCLTCSLALECNKILIAAGKPRVSSFMNMLGMLINVVLDPLMIFGGETCLKHTLAHTPEALHCIVRPVMSLFLFLEPNGIRGAAIATVISQCVSAVSLVFILYHLRLLRFQKLPWDTFFKTGRLIMTYGIPAMLSMLLFPIGNSITTWATSHFGDVAVAGVAAASRLENIAFVLPMSFGIPLMPFIAQNYGAKLYSRVRFCFKFAVSFAFITLNTAALILFFWGKHIIVYFTPEPAVQEVMVHYMRIVPFGFALIEIMRFSGFALVGCGYPVRDTILKCIRVCGIMIPMYFLTQYFHWYEGIFFSRLTTDLLGGIICFVVACAMIHRLPKQDGLDAVR